MAEIILGHADIAAWRRTGDVERPRVKLTDDHERSRGLAGRSAGSPPAAFGTRGRAIQSDFLHDQRQRLRTVVSRMDGDTITFGGF